MVTISCQNESPYNIPSPEPFFAGSYVELSFVINNPYSNQLEDLTNTANITFSMTLFGNYGNDIVLKFTRRDMYVGFPRMIIDAEQKNILTVILYPDDTKDFEDAWYDFQIKLHSVDGLHDSTIGQGRIQVYKQI